MPRRGLFFLYILFLLRPHAGRALTFCYAAESKQRTHPKGLAPLDNPRRCGNFPVCQPIAGRRQRKLCKEKPSPRVPSGTSRRAGVAATRATLWVAVALLAALPSEKIRPRARCRSALEPGSLYPRPRTATLRVATNSTQQSQTARLGRVLPMAGRTPPLGRDALRLLLPASTPSAHSRAPDPKQRSLSARLGKSYPINSSFIGLISF